MKRRLAKVWAVTLVVLRIWGASLFLSAISLGVSGFIAGRNLATIGTFLRDGDGPVPAAFPLRVVRPLWWVGANQPGIQLLRVLPGASWIPQSASAISSSWSSVTLLADEALRANRILEDGLLEPSGAFNETSISALAANSASLSEALGKLAGSIEFLDSDRGIFWQHPSRSQTVQNLREAHRAASAGLRTVRAMTPFVLSESQRTILLGVTNPAETRGVHGIIGQFAVLQVSRRGVEVREVASNLALANPSRIPTELSEGYVEIFGSTNSEWQNMTLSPFVDDAGEQIAAAWRSIRKERLDAVILLDTVAISRIATNSGDTYMTAQGRLLPSAEALSDYLSNGIYLEFPIDNLERKAFQTALGRRLVDRMLSRVGAVREILPALATSIREGRVAIWLNATTDPPQMGAVTIGPDSQALGARTIILRLNNFSGNKMDFYLQPSITLMSCDHELRLLLQFTNVAPRGKDLPDYVLRRLDSFGDEPASFVAVSLVAGSDWEVSQWFEADVKVPSGFVQLSQGQHLQLWLNIPIGESREVEVVVASRTRGILMPDLDLPGMAMPWNLQFRDC